MGFVSQLFKAVTPALGRSYATNGGTGVFCPMMQVFKDTKTGQWKRVTESPRPKDDIEWLRPSLFPQPIEVDLEGQKVSVLLAVRDRGWVLVDLDGKIKK